MRQLIPHPGRDDEPDLTAAYAYPGGTRRWLRANMVSSADGAAQAGDGLSSGLSGPPDRKVFRVLRGLADVVMVGAGTVRAEGYGDPVREREEFADARALAGQTPAAAIAVVSASLDVDFSSRLFTAAVARTITITVADAPADRLELARTAGEIVIAGTGHVDLAMAVRLLAESGRGRILAEGGPHLLRDLAAAGVLDELCLTISPQLRAGGQLRIMAGPELDTPLGLALHTLLDEDGYLFARYLTTTRETASSTPGYQD
jgi:5-amino-6-(5-phosphoribosylamino)uracil reductase